MTKKCVYCNQEISDKRSLDVCDKCGVGVWGKKMFEAILQNMKEADEKGNLSFNDPLEINNGSGDFNKFAA